jgi:hypothetical protein
MGWITRYKVKEAPHRCFFPSLMDIVKQGLDVGSIWECDTCKTRYMYTGGLMGVPQWEKGYPK